MFTLDNLGTGIQTLILGMLVVFLALAIIWLVVALVGMAFKKKDASAKDVPAATPAGSSAHAIPPVLPRHPP